MDLKTDYKDAMFDGQRRYRLIPNEDGTYSLPDETKYTQTGDKFGANDINSTNVEINKIQRTVIVTLPASGWSATAPYSQRLAVTGIKSTDEPELKLYIPKTLTTAQAKIRQKLTPMITSGELEDGYVTFYCSVKKPTADLQVLLKGVSTNG